MTRNIDTLLSALGANIGIADLTLDERGIASLTADGYPVTFHYEESGEVLSIFTKLGLMPEEVAVKAAISQMLLDKNCFFVGTAGGSLGVDRDDVIWYGLRLEVVGMGPQPFMARFLSLLKVTAKLREEISSFVTASATEQSTDAEKFNVNMLSV